MARHNVKMGHTLIRVGWDATQTPYFAVDIPAYKNGETKAENHLKLQERNKWIKKPNHIGEYYVAERFDKNVMTYRYYFTHQETAALFKLFHAPI